MIVDEAAELFFAYGRSGKLYAPETMAKFRGTVSGPGFLPFSDSFTWRVFPASTSWNSGER